MHSLARLLASSRVPVDTMPGTLRLGDRRRPTESVPPIRLGSIPDDAPALAEHFTE